MPVVTVADAEPLVTADELADYPGAPFSDLSVEIASATVRGSLMWHLAPAVAGVEYRIDLLSNTDLVILPALVVGEITSVVETQYNTPITGFTVSDAGALQLPCKVPAGLGRLKIIATVGLAECPVHIKSVVAHLARSFDASVTRPPDLRSRTVGGVSYTWVTPDTNIVADPLRKFEHILARYRL